MTKAILIAGLGFGDEGKGTTGLIVRYNGGERTKCCGKCC
jgi:hypothetical protein